MNMECKYKKIIEIEFISEEDEILGYSDETETTYCFNDISLLILNECDKKSGNEIAHHIITLCNLDQSEVENIKSDVCDFLTLLLKNKVIEEAK